MPSFTDILKSSQKGFLKNVLTGAGVTLGTAGLSLIALKSAISIFESSVSGMSSDISMFIGLSGLDVFFSIIIGATLAKHAQDSGKVFLQKL